MSGVCVWSLIEFGSGMECHASKNNLRDHKGLKAVYGLNIIKIKFVVVFHTVLRQKRVLVTCEDGAFVFFCSGCQCLECLTDTLELQLESLVLDTQRLVLQLVLVLASEPE